jgi:TPP-dependent trihydroxycyclohexane-1,2-dione (THcHDO) dehydratase
MLSVVISGTVWLIFGHGGIGNALQALAVAPDKMPSKGASAETGHEAEAETAAMEVGPDVENPK